MGYRWYDAQQIKPLFPFGYGLSYTHFSLSGLRGHTLANGDVTLTFTLKNSGKRAGAEVAQVYAQLPVSSGEPPQRLVAWQKLMLQPGQRKQINMVISHQRLAIWNVEQHQWQLPAGHYGLTVGDSSRDPDALRTGVDEAGAML